ncbi:unnamed protein product [Oppiella nova]|uniref:Uncharacterized protein n=1 Tax=Oppiella nova TaxID=334625 RepID=A0A7R9QCV9_9ACAR|nr:unnamed protein product [Oppiella nova]CAG2162744.1 unnamed protein product [Oppiella nova]
MILRSLRSNHLRYGFICVQNRSFKYRQTSRSFLSDKDRVRDFIALLGSHERQYLYEELHRLQQNVSQRWQRQVLETHCQTLRALDRPIMWNSSQLGLVSNLQICL